MPRFPYYRYPFQYYNPYQIQQYKRPNEPPKTSIENIVEAPPRKPLTENSWLDVFGIKLYFDDVLILSLLFFLYNEEVKDEGLFLALVMLLIS